MPATQEQELLGFVGDPLRTIVAHLAKNVIAVRSDTFELADLQECSFPGYAPITVRTWHVDPENQNDLAKAKADLLHWQRGPGGGAERVTILYLTQSYNGGDPQLWRIHMLEPQYLMTKEDQSIDLVLDLIFADLPD